jgi:glycosyltransferase involved in cell wall biosynthesis
VNAPPLVTFYVPVYNGAAYLGEALDSIAAQSFGDWECIVVDDYSTDGCAAILERLRDSRFRVMRQPANLNVANASNLAIRVARGKYLARLDQDDLAEPGRLSEQVAFLEQHPEVAVCGGAMQLFGSRSETAVFPAGDAEIKANLLVAIGNIANPTSMVRMDFLLRHSILNDPRFPLSCDYGMWVDCALAGARFANLQTVLTRYRTHAGQSSNDMERLQQGVIVAKTRLLQAWFPDISWAEVLALEPILRANGNAFLTREAAQAGLAVCEKVSAPGRPSVNGENRERVEAFLRERSAIWQAHVRE